MVGLRNQPRVTWESNIGSCSAILFGNRIFVTVIILKIFKNKSFSQIIMRYTVSKLWLTFKQYRTPLTSIHYLPQCAQFPYVLTTPVTDAFFLSVQFFLLDILVYNIVDICNRVPCILFYLLSTARTCPGGIISNYHWQSGPFHNLSVLTNICGTLSTMEFFLP